MTPEDSLKKREEFAISLRKKATQEKILSKRKAMMMQAFRRTSNEISSTNKSPVRHSTLDEEFVINDL